MLYTYRAHVLNVHDGDTVTVDIDLGFHVWVRGQVIRLDGLDAPELRTPAGPAAAQALSTLVLGKDVTLRTIKDKTEKYGRMLGALALDDGMDVNAYLISAGFARPYHGEKRMEGPLT
jgi:micrococcal nuclease